MPSQNPKEKLLDFPTMCATYDHGGGVGLDDAFVIYTTRKHNTRDSPSSLQDINALTSLASEVAEYIKIHYTLPPASCLRTLPHETPSQPSFFINVYSSKKICLAGTGDAATTLLGVLGRVWCILELCSAVPRGLVALLEFAQFAQAIDGKGYAAAVALLLHQRQCQIGPQRTLGMAEVLDAHEYLLAARSNECLAQLKEICAVLFRPSLDSFNGFYMRAIVTVAVWMGVGWHTVARYLAGHEDAIHQSDLLSNNATLGYICRGDSMPFYGVGESSNKHGIRMSRRLDALLELHQVEQSRKSMGHYEDAALCLPVAKEASLRSPSRPAQNTIEALIRQYKFVLEFLELKCV